MTNIEQAKPNTVKQCLETLMQLNPKKMAVAGGALFGISAVGIAVGINFALVADSKLMLAAAIIASVPAVKTYSLFTKKTGERNYLNAASLATSLVAAAVIATIAGPAMKDRYWKNIENEPHVGSQVNGKNNARDASPATPKRIVYQPS